MSSESSLKALATRITESVETIDTFLAHSSSPSPSPSLSDDMLPADAPQNVQRARQSLLEATQKIQQLSTGPSEFLEQHQIYYQILSCLNWLLHFNILNYIPSNNEAIPFTTLASSASVPLTRLKSVARMSMTGGFLREPQPEHVAHSHLSAAFIAQPAFQDWARFMTRYSAPTAQHFADATARWGDTQARNQTAYNIAFNTELPFFQHVAESKERTALFGKYMRSLGQSEALAPRHVLDGFNWEGLGKAHVVDVGGSTGQIAVLLATHHPSLHFTVQDLPDTVANGPGALSSLPHDIASRITFTAHDFFTPQPPSLSADVYYLRKILHDWSLGHARTILQHLATAMKSRPKARLVVMDTILPLAGEMAPGQEAMLRVKDLTMAQSFNSKEREWEEWEELFGSTEPRLRVESWRQPFGSAMAVMEVVVAGDGKGDGVGEYGGSE